MRESQFQTCTMNGIVFAFAALLMRTITILQLVLNSHTGKSNQDTNCRLAELLFVPSNNGAIVVCTMVIAFVACAVHKTLHERKLKLLLALQFQVNKPNI